MSALRVIDGGWRKDEARIEALAFMDEAANDAERIYALLHELEAAHGPDPKFGQGQFCAMRLMRRATVARMEMAVLEGPRGAA